MPSDEGMLFVFPGMTEGRFWGKNTYIPLDLAFVQDDTVTEITSIAPLSTRTVSSRSFCNRAIEANAGWFKDNDVKVGDKIDIIKEENGQNVIVFKR